MTARARKLVVAGLIVADDGRVLVSQRQPGGPLGGQWEFPGGKLEPGEAPTVGLVRELAEELGVAVEVGPIWDVLHHAYPDFDLLMLVYVCRLTATSPPPRALEVAAFAWCRPAEVGGYPILPADAPLVTRLAVEGAPRWSASPSADA